MTMMQIVNQLVSQGHQVDFYIRKDGGILIKKIDGERYPTGASGNARARELVGASISEARIKQLRYATRVRKQKKPSLPDDINKEYLRVKRKWNKAFKAKEGKAHPAGYFGKSRIKYAFEHFGRNEAMRRIQEAERYASGIAYSKNVAILANFIEYAGVQYQSDDLMKLANDVRDNAYTIKEEWIQPAYDELYKLNSGIPPKEVAKNTRTILRL